MRYAWYHNMSKLKDGFSRRARTRRMALFVKIMDIKGGEKIIDLGGSPQFWSEIRGPLDITIINLPGFNPPYDGSSHHRITLLEGDACDTEFADNSFDIAFSNSVIEHVGGDANEDRLAREAKRLAAKYWVQTPSIWFPIEAHNMMPFWWFYPKSLQRFFMARWRKKLPGWTEMLDGTTVISRDRMTEMFDDGELISEKSGGFTKSYIAYRA